MDLAQLICTRSAELGAAGAPDDTAAADGPRLLTKVRTFLR